MHYKMSGRICIIGLDGACWELLEPWLESGELPNLASIKAEGSYGSLKSTLPPVSIPAWPSFLTGKNPGKHGLVAFWYDGPQKKFYNARHIGTETLLSICTEYDRTVVSLNVPGTYPPQPVKGAIVSSILTPSENLHYTYPRELKPELLEKIGDYVIDFDRSKRGEESFRNICYVAHQRFKAGRYLWHRYDWDLFMLVFTDTDRLQHRFWYHKNKLLTLYKAIDEFIGELVSKLYPSDTVIILSDHGFTEVKEHIYLNSWLRQKGYLKTGIAMLRGTTQRRHSWLRRIFPRFKLDIAWSRTKAFCYSHSASGIRINLRGREPRGCVPPDDYENLRQSLLAELSKLHNSEPLFSTVALREELYEGPYIDRLPDVCYIIAREGHAIKRAPNRREILEPCRSRRAGHNSTGLFIVKGGAVKSGVTLEAELIDIAPTVLYLLGLPIPDDADGQVLTHLIEPSTLQSAPPRYRHPRQVESKHEADTEDRELTERLRQLGYID